MPNPTTFRIALALTASALTASTLTSLASTPAYLDHVWEHRGSGFNLIRIADGPHLAVTDDGAYLIDSSIIPQLDRQQFRFDSLQQFAGNYYLARDLANHGFNWFRISDGNTFLTRDALQSISETPHLHSTAFLLDPDPIRGDTGLTFFPQGGLALLCGRHHPGDSRISGLYPAFKDGKPNPFTDLDDVALPIKSEVSTSVRAEELLDRAVIDPPAPASGISAPRGRGLSANSPSPTPARPPTTAAPAPSIDPNPSPSATAAANASRPPPPSAPPKSHSTAPASWSC